METKQKVIPYKVKLLCDTCFEEMRLDKNVLLSYPAQYTYCCPICKRKEINSIQYPYIEHIEIRERIEPTRYTTTPKGIAFINYLKDREEGKDVYIQEYEDLILELNNMKE